MMPRLVAASDLPQFTMYLTLLYACCAVCYVCLCFRGVGWPQCQPGPVCSGLQDALCSHRGWRVQGGLGWSGLSVSGSTAQHNTSQHITMWHSTAW